MVQLGGDFHCITFLVDGQGAVSFHLDVHADPLGSSHQGTITCPGPVRIVAEERRDGAGVYLGSVQGNVFHWEARCPRFTAVHYTIHLAY